MNQKIKGKFVCEKLSSIKSKIHTIRSWRKEIVDDEKCTTEFQSQQQDDSYYDFSFHNDNIPVHTHQLGNFSFENQTALKIAWTHGKIGGREIHRFLNIVRGWFLLMKWTSTARLKRCEINYKLSTQRIDINSNENIFWWYHYLKSCNSSSISVGVRVTYDKVT